MAKRRQQSQQLFQETEADLPFPLEGVDITRGFTRQRSGTTVSAQNVRSFDPQTDRARGAQRPGLVKYFPTFAVGNKPIQSLDHLTLSSASFSGQQQNSAATAVGAPAPTAGQFVYGRAAGSGFGVARGTSGASLWTGGANAGYQFACSCWDGAGNLYVAQVNTATGATIISAWQPNGTLLWSQAGPSVATGSLRNLAGMAVNSVSGELFIAVIAAAAPLYRLWDYQTANGQLNSFGGFQVPMVANDATAAFSGHAANVVDSQLGFSTASVNCLALLNPAANSVLGIDTFNGYFIIVRETGTDITATNYAYTGLTKTNGAKSKVVSDGVNFYALIGTTTNKVAKISSAGVIAWTSSAFDAATPQDLCFDPQGPNYLVVVGTASGALRSANVVDLSTGAFVSGVNVGTVTTWNVVGADGKGNFTFWRNAVAANDVIGTNNNLSTAWGPSTLANTTHTGASVNRVEVQTSGNVITVTNPTATQAVVVGTSVSITCTATDSGGALTLTWSAGNLPPGLSINATTGVISGTPTASAQTTFVGKITAADTDGASGSLTVTWTVSGTAQNRVTLSSPGNQTGTAGTALTLTVTATDSAPAQTLRYVAYSLPPGLTINSATGLISGTPLLPGSYAVRVTATDTTGSQGQASWQWTITGTALPGTVGRKVVGLVVSGGEIRRFNELGTTPVAGGAGALRPQAPVVWAAPCLQQMFYVDGAGYVRYGSASNQVVPWVATAGTLPVDALKLPATLIALWRGRIVLSGLPNDPANWFMSKQLDPLDWQYSPATTTTTQAVAGNNSPAGTIGDVITCLLPYTDDTMLIGCTHSIWQMTGDPADGGQITNISHTLGMAWGRPYAIDPFGQIYFMGSDRAVYKMVPGALPVRISQAVNKLLLDVHLSDNLVTMAWDMVNQGLAVFITPYAARATTHWFWEERTNSWWPQVFANTNHDPLAVHVYEGDAPGQDLVMMGGRDGYVRNWLETAGDDDGTPIASFVVFGPLQTRDLDDILLKCLQATMADTSGPVTWQVFVGPTAEAALASPSVASGSWGAGYNGTDLVRYSGTQVFVKVSATTPWAAERISARFAPQGRIRSRGMGL